MVILVIVYPRNGRGLCHFYVPAVEGGSQLAHTSPGHSGPDEPLGYAQDGWCHRRGGGRRGGRRRGNRGSHRRRLPRHVGWFGRVPVSPVEPGSLHGEYVVADGHGGFSTLVSQTGRITAISATSVTARSDDGFVQTYAIHDVGATALPPFAVTDEVIINAKREGSTAMVTTMRPPLAPSH